MPALRPAVKGRRVWLILAAAGLILALAIADWNRSPAQQMSVQLYERVVILPYRALVRPTLARFVRCRYVPTCSQYSVEAVRTYGFPKGAWLTAKRLGRCLPWVPMGTFDPIPPKT